MTKPLERSREMHARGTLQNLLACTGEVVYLVLLAAILNGWSPPDRSGGPQLLVWEDGAIFDYGSLYVMALVWAVLIAVTSIVVRRVRPEEPPSAAERTLETAQRIRLYGNATDEQDTPCFSERVTGLFFLVGVGALIRLAEAFLAYTRATREIKLDWPHIGIITLAGIALCVVAWYRARALLTDEPIDGFWRLVAVRWLGWSSLFVPTTYLLVTRGVVFTFLCRIMAEGVWIPLRRYRRNLDSLSRISLGVALVLSILSVVAVRGELHRLLEWVRAGFVGLPDGVRPAEFWWYPVAVASIVTSLGQVLGFSHPRVCGAWLWRAPSAETSGLQPSLSTLRKTRRRVWMGKRLLLALALLAAVCGAVTWPGNAAWYVLLALLIASFLNFAPRGSFPMIVLVVVPRWSIWLSVMRQAPLSVCVIYLLCEAALLLPTWWPKSECTEGSAA